MNLRTSCTKLEDIALRMTSSLDLQEVLTMITHGLVDDIDASFARIWLLDTGDLCTDCYQSSCCTDQKTCLHLKASAGVYKNLNGQYRRVPLNEARLGKIATTGEPILTSDLSRDDRFSNKKWINENGFRSFVGYPLTFRDKRLGTLAMFSRLPMSENEFRHIAGFANQAAIAIKNAQLFASVEQLKNRLEAENTCLREEIKAIHNDDEIIGQSAALKLVMTKVNQVAATDITTLILGETGTGKELIARAVYNRSARRERPLVVVNCATLTANLIESELFGHEKGAFTSAQSRQIGRFELASDATLFLDEIGELPLPLQPKLLRVLQDGKFERLGSSRTIKTDVRVIAATSRDLEQEIRRGAFRQDLWYRLNVFPITVPPLRDRMADIPLLVDYMVDKFNRKLGRSIKTIPAGVIKDLQHYSWPGNIRELENVIERAIITTQGTRLQLAENLRASMTDPDVGNPGTSLEKRERAYILEVLKTTRWKIEGKNGAAQVLQLNPSTLRSRMRKLVIKRP